MLKTHEQFRFPGDGKGQIFIFEVNWSKDKDIADCKKIRVIFPDKTDTIIDRDNLLAFCFAIGKPEQQMNLIPQKNITKRRFEGLVRMTATKDIMKGEEIVTRCFHDLPDFEEEIIGAARKEQSGIIIPK